MEHPSVQVLDPIGATGSEVSEVVELEGTIKHAIASIESNKRVLKEKQQQIKDRLMSNSAYAASVEDVKEAQREKAMARKKAIAADPELDTLIGQTRTLKADSKSWQLSLGEYLTQYHEKGMNTVSTDDGELLELETVVRIKQKTI